MEETNKPNQGWELFRFAVIAFFVILFTRLFIAQPFIVSGPSMSPTFENADYLIIDEISYYLNEPKRYDVVVFRYPKDTKKFFIKRIIGLPNEVLEIEGSKVTVINSEYPQGLTLDDSFVENKSENSMSIKLREDEYFVMGDNRSASSDSRYWGPVTRNLVVGKAFARLWPIKNMEIYPGKFIPNN